MVTLLAGRAGGVHRGKGAREPVNPFICSECARAWVFFAPPPVCPLVLSSAIQAWSGLGSLIPGTSMSSRGDFAA